jgi:uracil-DNA glycosylase
LNKLVIVGQAPGRGSGGPCEGRFGRKLAELFGCTYDEYIAGTERANVLKRWPGKCGKGDAFPMKKARLAARRMVRSLAGKRVLLLGKRTAEAFGLEDGYLSWSKKFVKNGAFPDVAVVPHPSGINRWFNDGVNRAACRGFMQQAWRAR